MGLCKCRVVTNLFCFEHKTNVCEKCIIASHRRVRGLAVCARLPSHAHARTRPALIARLTLFSACSRDSRQCVVKSYLQWLQDSDYDATCTLCRKSLQTGEVIRLSCLGTAPRASTCE